MLKLSSVAADNAQPPMIGTSDKYTGSGNVSPSKNLETNTLKAGSLLLIIWVKETATLDILTVAATWPIVWATATYITTITNSTKLDINKKNHVLDLSIQWPMIEANFSILNKSSHVHELFLLYVSNMQSKLACLRPLKEEAFPIESFSFQSHNRDPHIHKIK